MLFVRNLPFNISAEEMYEIFGKFGAIRQIRQVKMCQVSVGRVLFGRWPAHTSGWQISCRAEKDWMAAEVCIFARAQGVAKDTRGTAFVVYEDIYDAKMAVEHLSGFNVANRYLIVLYYNPSRQTKKVLLRAVQVVSSSSDVVIPVHRVPHQTQPSVPQHIAEFCLSFVTQMSTKEKEAELRAMQEKYGVDGAPFCADRSDGSPACKAHVSLSSADDMSQSDWSAAGNRLLLLQPSTCAIGTVLQSLGNVSAVRKGLFPWLQVNSMPEQSRRRRDDRRCRVCRKGFVSPCQTQQGRSSWGACARAVHLLRALWCLWPGNHRPAVQG